MSVTDTQILSYYYKGVERCPASGITISSITAAEFLLIQSKRINSANYYPILPSLVRHLNPIIGHVDSQRLRFDGKKHAQRGRRRTDQLILNFNGKIPSVVEFGSFAISAIINEHREDLFYSSISHLTRDTQKKLRSRFQFLLDSNVHSLPVTESVAEIGVNIFGQFLDKYTAKANLRNTINDVLILATAVKQALPLLTKDSLLSRFAAELLGAPVMENRLGLALDFTAPQVADSRKKLESKGYINRGWQVIERRGAR
jgi:predicted nucleic acid-binding protein